ncbi:MAG TPA: hypothetical protein VF720_08435, partial [Candidatus Eisenbacteria bacterium]
LINRYVKRNPRSLQRVALLIIVMRLVEIFFSVAPAHEDIRPFAVHWLDLAVPVGLTGLWLAAFLNELKGRTAVPGINHLSEEKAPHVG